MPEVRLNLWQSCEYSCLALCHAILINLPPTLSLHDFGLTCLRGSIGQQKVDCDLGEGECVRLGHHELDLKRLLPLIDVFLVHDEVGEPLAHLRRHTDLLEREQSIRAPTHQLKCRVLIRLYTALLARVLAGIDREVDRFVHKLHLRIGAFAVIHDSTTCFNHQS